MFSSRHDVVQLQAYLDRSGPLTDAYTDCMRRELHQRDWHDSLDVGNHASLSLGFLRRQSSR